VFGVVKEQTHLELVEIQGRVALQVPPQVDPWTPFRSCRAETVPTHRTAMAIAARNVFLIVLLMIHFPFYNRSEEDEYGPATVPIWLQ
jgi:hypothetical protein